MAACDVCQEEEVAFIVGDAATGEQQFMGPGCFARFGLEFAKALLPAEEIASALGPMFVEGGRSDADKPAGGRKRRKQAETPAEPNPEQNAPQGGEKAPPAASDG